MNNENDYGITPEQYHAGLDKLWEALENVRYNGTDDVFTMCAKRINELENKLEEIRINRSVKVSDMSAPDCLRCGAKMVRRKANGNDFFGCSRYPRCTYTTTRRFNKHVDYKKISDPVLDCDFNTRKG